MGAVSLTIVSRPDFRGMAAAIERERERLAQRIGNRLVQKEIPSAFSSQGTSIGLDRWAPRSAFSGGGPALIGISARTRFRITANGFTVFWDWPYAGQQQGSSKGGGGFIPAKGRRASPLMWLSFRPGVKSPRELAGTFLQPIKAAYGAVAKEGGAGYIVMQRLNGQKEPTAVGLLVPRVSIPQRRFGSWVTKYREAAIAEYEAGLVEILKGAGL